MKTALFTLLVVILFSCSKSRKISNEPFPYLLASDVEWITYEGILPNVNGQDVLVELELLPGAPGMESYFKLNETLSVSSKTGVMAMGSQSHGKYTVLFGSSTHNFIQINNKALLRSIMRGKPFTPDDHVDGDLLLRSQGDHKLVLMGRDLQEVDPRYTLIRRSELFTVEGYFTLYNDSTTDYYERNTQKKWAVARFGCYDEAVRGYNVLAKEEFEGIYLKALSYSIRHTDERGKEADALVFKRILVMDSTNYKLNNNF